MNKVLHVITGLHDGGAEGALFRLCTYDSENIHQVISMTEPGKYGPLLEAQGIQVTCLGMPRGRLTSKGLFQLWRQIRKTQPDVVQTWMYHADLVGGVLARLAGCQNVIWGIRNTTLSRGESTHNTIRVARLCARLSSFVPRRILCCAEKARSIHSALGYDERRMRVVPNGYDLSTFRPDSDAREALRKELGIPPEAFLLGFVARFDPQKDHANLLHALARLRDAGKTPLCLLVGTGLETGNPVIVRMITELGLTDQVRLLGRRTDIPDVMNALDLHVMSSAFGEAFPNVLCEAMACGTPCVTTDVGDAVLIVSETGWAVPPRDSVALSEALGRAMDCRGHADWTARKEAARRRIEAHFTLERMREGYHAVWRS